MRRRSFTTLLVGEASLLREGIRHLLCAADFAVRETADSVHDLAIEPSRQQSALLVILDPAQDAKSAAGQIEVFKERHPASRVAVVADRHRVDCILAAFQAGANLYFVQSGSADTLIKGLELVMLGETILPRELLPYIQAGTFVNEEPSVIPSPRLSDDLPTAEVCDLPRLSGREECILRCIVEGHPNKVIARKMDITEATVKVHVKAILRKIRVHNRTQAAIWAVNRLATRINETSLVSPVDFEAPRLSAPDMTSASIELPLFRAPIED